MFDTVSSSTGTTSSAPQAAQSQKKLAEDLNQFLTLLTTQLKHQDPLDPMDATEFTSQLVQFASVEQQIYANANLEKLLSVQQTSQLGALVSYIGKDAEAKGDEVTLTGGKAEFTYELAANAQETTITIRDSTGSVVYFTGGETDAGKHSFAWNGKDNFGFAQDDGVYTVTVSALDRDGNPIDVTQTVFGRVTGVTQDGSQAYLYVGDVPVKMEDILAVKEATATQ
jgi:flagellar basal-body rod modification protein FlgD